MKRANVVIAPALEAPAKEVAYIDPQHNCDFKKCEVAIHVGLFFDGTKNNFFSDYPSHSHSNIARLYKTYDDDTTTGHHSFYIPGVGTEFLDIGEHGTSKLGAGSGSGCEGRVIYGLLSVFNAMHIRSLGNKMFNDDAILALCRNSRNVTNSADLEVLLNLGINKGLLEPNIGNSSARNEFLTQQAFRLQSRLKQAKPRIVECFVDVFGFSRGAAEARVFCHWLDELLIGGSLAGVPLRFRFVGIMDTVASAGIWSGISALATNSTGGHGAWANAESLKIPSSVKNCVHMVAMHELRRNFPLDEIGINGKLESNWIQRAYPGVHSDVGGGYKPGELGISVGDDSLKLSQIPLNHMFTCAVAAGTPMKKPQLRPNEYDEFAIHSDVAKAYESFILESTLAPRPIYEWLQPYLNWRWQVRDHFHTINHVKRANAADKELLLKFNRILISDAAAMSRSTGLGAIRRTIAVGLDFSNTGARKDLAATSLLEPEAREIFALAQRTKSTSRATAALFEDYVHDSLAGFGSTTLELTGYWRYRKVFLGTDNNTIAANQDSNIVQNVT